MLSALILSAALVQAQTCSADSCTAQISTDLPATLGEWAEMVLIAGCTPAFDDKMAKEGWGKERMDAVLKEFYSDKTPFGGDSNEAMKVQAGVGRIGGTSLMEPDCNRLEHYFIQVPGYMRMMGKLFDYYVARPGGGSWSVTPFSDSSRLSGKDVLVRVPKEGIGLETFGPKLDDAQLASLRKAVGQARKKS